MNEQDDEPGTRGGFARLGDFGQDLQARLDRASPDPTSSCRGASRGTTLIRAFITCLKQEPDSEEAVASQAGQCPGCGKTVFPLFSSFF